MATAALHTPIGTLTVQAGPRGLVRLAFPGARLDRARDPDPGPAAGPLAAARRQLAEYFAGRRRTFDLPLDLTGTAFQQEVWRALSGIPYGETVTYTELARRIGRPGSVRAVAAANARTPVPVIVPCHRVIGVDGSLTGYAGGLDRKRALLDLERG